MFNHHYRYFMLLVLILLASLTGCAQTTTSAENAAMEGVTLINPVGPIVIPAAGLISGAVESSVPITVQYWKTGDEAIGLLSNDTAQFAVLPITTAVNMNAAGLDLALLGVHEWKVFYLVAADGQAFNGWDSLIGKTIYTPESKGQTVDVLTRYALTEAGITPRRAGYVCLRSRCGNCCVVPRRQGGLRRPAGTLRYAGNSCRKWLHCFGLPGLLV